MGYALVWLINAIISLMIWFIIAQAILSWLVAFDVVNYRNRFVYSVGTFLDRVTAPLLEPFRPSSRTWAASTSRPSWSSCCFSSSACCSTARRRRPSSNF